MRFPGALAKYPAPEPDSSDVTAPIERDLHHHSQVHQGGVLHRAVLVPPSYLTADSISFTPSRLSSSNCPRFASRTIPMRGVLRQRIIAE